MEEELTRLCRENRELKRANAILKTTSALFGVEAICRVLRQADRGFITSRGYRKTCTPIPSARALNDSLLIPQIQRHFRAQAPGRLWVADTPYVRTLSGFAYTAFVTDVFSRTIVGVATRSTMRTDALPMEA